MNRKLIRTYLYIPFLLPHTLLYLCMRLPRLKEDLERYNELYEIRLPQLLSFWYHLACSKTFRNVFYKRIGLFRYLCPLSGEKTCFIACPDMGGGAFIEHGTSTYIYAHKIGKKCYINQDVTIGFVNKTDAPVLGDNVEVKAGAKVFGKITIGNNVIIGANAVVCKDVPDNCTVVGVPAYIIKRNGKRVNETL